MKILHCCLANFYIDNYGYQENVLPRMHQLQGHEVAIVASTVTFVDNKAYGYVEPRSYATEEGIPITRLPYIRGVPKRIAKKLRMYRGLKKVVESFGPEIIFLHNPQFLDVKIIAHYVENNPQVKVYADSHSDFGNSAKGWFSKNILHKYIYRKCCTKVIEPFVTKFYGVLPARVDFLQEMYGIPAEKTELLVLGADLTQVDLSNREQIRASTRKSLGIKEEDFVLVTGGKIGPRKNTETLMQVIRKIDREDLKLIVFGTPNDQMKSEIESLSQHRCIKNVGWVPAEKTYDYLIAADLGVFPGTHSVLWEQAVGVGLPCIFKKWDGMQHVDVGGNCLFLDSASNEEIEETILRVWNDKSLYARMQSVALEKGVSHFSYYEIAKRAIEA